jgi:UDP-GlcNAc:undecaprenyl-phosphate GlcNAc-1-phosphate transferase
MPLLTPVFVLAIPLYDTASVVLIRLLQKRSIAIGDQSHFHHRLMKLGFSHRQTVAFIVLLAFSVALSAVRLVQASLFQSIIIFVQILSMMSIIILAERVAVKVRNQVLERRQARPEEKVPVDEMTRL